MDDSVQWPRVKNPLPCDEHVDLFDAAIDGGKVNEENVSAAKAICMYGTEAVPGECHIRAQCLRWALRNSVHGVWGGTDEDERRKMARRDGVRPTPYRSPVAHR